MRLSSLVIELLFGAVFCVGAAVMGVYGAIVARKRAAARRAAMAGYAGHREWEYRQRDDSLVDRFAGAPFGRGEDRKATNVFLGRHDGRHFVAFDYEYGAFSGSGDDEEWQDYQFSVVAMSLGVTTPGISVGPSGKFGRLVKSVPGRRVKIGNQEFDEVFTVVSPSAQFARDVLHPGVVEVLMQRPDFVWRLEGESMLVIRKGQHSPEEIETKLDFMDAVLDRIPEHVRSQLLGEPPR